jgi:hypothetical protein
MILDNDELYAAISSLIDALQRGGEDRWGVALGEALSISTVPGEILGETRLQLRELRATSIPQKLGIEIVVDEAIAYLDSVL